VTADHGGGPGTDLRANDQDEVSFLLALFFGRDPLVSDSDPDPNLGLLVRQNSAEPTLIPHLPRVTHDFSASWLAEMAQSIGNYFALQIWESTQLAFHRHGEGGRDLWERPSYRIDPHLELDVLIAASDLGSPDDSAPVDPALLSRISALNNQNRADQLHARLAIHLDDTQTRLLVDRVDPHEIEAESARALLEAARHHRVELSPDWVVTIVNRHHPTMPDHDAYADPEHRARVTHLLAAMPEPTRTEHADWLAGVACERFAPPWFAAYLVSVAAPFVSKAGVWDALPSFEPFWDSWIQHLIAAPPASMEEVLLRSHPLRHAVESIEERHEPTERILGELGQWVPILSAPPVAKMEASVPAPPDLPHHEPANEPATQSDHSARMFQADVVVDGNKRTRTFALGVPNKVRFSVGRNAALSTSVAFPDVDAQGHDEVTLPVWLSCPGQDPITTSIVLPTDKALDSSWAELIFTPEQDWVKDVIAIVYSEDGTEVLQAASLSGAAVDPALADADQVHEQLVFTRTDVRSIDEAPAAVPFATLVHTDTTTAITTTDGSPVGLGASFTAASGLVRSYMAALETTADDLELGVGDITSTLIEAARFGYLLGTQLSPEHRQLADEDHIRVVSVVNSVVMPLELLYNGPNPDIDADLCDGWQSALSSTVDAVCPSCGPDLSDASIVCPLQFWSMSKVLEHHGPSMANTAHPFSAQALTGTHQTSGINPFASALIAGSNKIASGVDSPIADLAAMAADDIVDETTVVKDWAQWTEAIERRDPSLLIAMAHQDVATNELIPVPSLEIGGIPETIFDQTHVRPSHNEDGAGPVMILLGCNTAVDPGNSIASFASRFKGQGAATVISSLGEVIASQAAPSAEILLRAMKAAFDTPGATIGDALLHTRRQLLADNKLLGLMLVMHGGSELATHP